MNELEISSVVHSTSAHNHSQTSSGAWHVRCMPGVLPVSRCGARNRAHTFIQQKTEVSEPCDVTVPVMSLFVVYQKLSLIESCPV